VVAAPPTKKKERNITFDQYPNPKMDAFSLRKAKATQCAGVFSDDNNCIEWHCYCLAETSLKFKAC